MSIGAKRRLVVMAALIAAKAPATKASSDALFPAAHNGYRVCLLSPTAAAQKQHLQLPQALIAAQMRNVECRLPAADQRLQITLLWRASQPLQAIVPVT